MTSVTVQQRDNASLWRNPHFLILIGTSIFLGLGQKIYSLALPLLVFDLTGSATWMGWMRAVEFLPNLLLALFIGVWVDRVNRKRWALIMLAMQASLLLVTFSAFQWHMASLWILFPVAFLFNACSYGFHNANMGIVKTVLPHHQLNLAIARLSGVGNLFDTAGPALSGLLLLLVALHWPLLWVGVFIIMALSLYDRLPWPQAAPPAQHPPMLHSLKEAWFALKANRPLWLITWMVVVVNTTSGIFDIQAIYAAKAVYQMNSAEVGLMASLAGIGALLGSIIAPYIRRLIGMGRTLLVSVLLEGLCFLFPAVLISVWGLYLGLALAGFFGVIANICIWSYRQESTDTDMIGRVAGITGSLFKLGLPFGLAASGYAVSWLGVMPVFLGCAVVQGVIVVVLMNTEVGGLP